MPAPCSMPTDLDPLANGQTAPNFTFPHPDKTAESLESMRGQTVVLVFSPPGWDPARGERIAQYKRALAQFPEIGAKLVDVSEDGRWYDMSIDRSRVKLPVIAGLDPNGEIAQSFGVYGHHAIFVIDERGIVRWSHVCPQGLAPKPDDLLVELRKLIDTPRSQVLPLSRRQFVAAALATAVALAIPHRLLGDAPPTPATGPPSTPVELHAVPLTLNVNGTDHNVSIDPRVTLLDALRERIGLTGTKKGCDHGQCGACTVHVDGRRVNSCLTLALTCAGKRVTTIEGLAHGDKLHPLQTAFITRDGFQCGFCTSGQIMSGVALLNEPMGPEDSDVQEAMSGNICRCGAYPNITAAVQDVRKGGKNNAAV